jgi:hypothetical protein
VATVTDDTPPGWRTAHPPNDGPGRFITGQLLFRHRDGGILRETHIGDAAIPRRDDAEFVQTMRDLAAELRRAADLLDPPPDYGVHVTVNGKRIPGVTGMTINRSDDGPPIRVGSHAAEHLWPSEGPVPPEIETP